MAERRLHPCRSYGAGGSLLLGSINMSPLTGAPDGAGVLSRGWCSTPRLRVSDFPRFSAAARAVSKRFCAVCNASVAAEFATPVNNCAIRELRRSDLFIDQMLDDPSSSVGASLPMANTYTKSGKTPRDENVSGGILELVG